MSDYYKIWVPFDKWGTDMQWTLLKHRKTTHSAPLNDNKQVPFWVITRIGSRKHKEYWKMIWSSTAVCKEKYKYSLYDKRTNEISIIGTHNAINGCRLHNTNQVHSELYMKYEKLMPPALLNTVEWVPLAFKRLPKCLKLNIRIVLSMKHWKRWRSALNFT